jgi:hypothetical protein
MNKPSDDKSADKTATGQVPACNVGECKEGECKDAACPAGACKPSCVVVNGEAIACESANCEKSPCESHKNSTTTTTITVAGKPSCSKEGEFAITSSCPVQSMASELGCDGEYVNIALSGDDVHELHTKHVPPVPFAVSTLTSAVPTPPQAIRVTQVSNSMFDLIKENAELKVKLEMMEAMYTLQEEMNAKLMELAIENARLTAMLAKSDEASETKTATVSTESSQPRCTMVTLLKSKPATVVQTESNCPSVPSVPSVQLSGAQVEVETTESLKLPLRMKIDTNELIEQVIQAVEKKHQQDGR